MEVKSSSTIVLPIMANTSKVPVKSIGENSFTGLAEGNFNTSVRLTQVVAPSKSLVSGIEVYTSGLGETYPADVFVGILNEVESTDANVFKVATITVPWALSEIDAVTILRNQ
ncbi:hypothetical protein KC573_01645 [candidate division WWE3 bacterium]|uniref:Rod shape-determining protein MreC beta-barrel core domain-containing protein n=1 Tax=candidate division WWE3 bacterium TaxID=2053526 RepID=A0A955LWI9_UNCKA|nr:hypothetical protein [candidate division WWE3 bacterium]